MIDTTKRPTVSEVTYMMLRKAQRDLIHRLEREYPVGVVYDDGFLVEDFRALLKVARDLLWETEGVREAQADAHFKYEAAKELHLDEGKRAFVLNLEYRISGQRCRIRGLEEMNAQLRAGDTSGLAASYKAEKASHKRTSERFLSVVRQRDEALARLAVLEKPTWWGRITKALGGDE